MTKTRKRFDGGSHDFHHWEERATLGPRGYITFSSLETWLAESSLREACWVDLSDVHRLCSITKMFLFTVSTNGCAAIAQHRRITFT
jgi:hypothetical protein